MLDAAALQKEILCLLKENSGEMEEESICILLGIAPYDIPWGYNIGWARLLQANQKNHLILYSSNRAVFLVPTQN